MGVEQVEGQNYINNAMMTYSAEVLLNRAIPVLQDGFKPAYRHILTSMFMKKEFHLTKTANVSGEIMKLHPHGSVSGTIVKMVQKDRNLVPLLDGNGNFGQYTSGIIQPAADRYTEVKLNDFAKNQLINFNKNTVNTVKNYDGTVEMPEVLPVTFPLVLMYCAHGVGVGYASDTVSFNMNDISKLMHEIINGGTKVIYPDFATGGLMDKDAEEIKNIMENGHGKIMLRAKIEKAQNALIITEIPFNVKREKIIDKVIKSYQNGKLPEIKNIKDLTDINGLKIKIEIQKNTNVDDLIQRLYKYTPMQSSITTNMNIIDIEKGTPEVLGVFDICKRWLKWRVDCYKKQLQNEISEYDLQLEILKGYEIIQNKLDEVIKIIRKSKKDEVTKNLIDLGLSKRQAETILNIRLYNLNNIVIAEKIEEAKLVSKKKDETIEILNSDNKILEIIDDEISSIAKKFGGKRRTKVAKFDYSMPKMIAKKQKIDDNSEVYVNVLSNGLINKSDNNSFKTPSGTSVMLSKKLHNSGLINIITDNRMCYGIRLNEIKQNDSLVAISDYTDFVPENENILAAFYQDENDKDMLIFGYSSGKIFKFPITSFSIKARKIKNAFAKNEELSFCYLLKNNENIDIQVTSSVEKNIINSDDISEKKSRSSSGVFAISKNRNKENNVKFERK